MGNRANVVFVAGYDNRDHPDPRYWKPGRISPTIYLHWNGGPESVYAFLAELDSRDIRADGEYDAARFCQIVGEFFDDDYRSGLSLGITAAPEGGVNAYNLERVPTDNSDNGFYVVDRTAAGITHRVRRFTSSRFNIDGYDPDGSFNHEDVRFMLTEWDKERVDAEYARVLEDAVYRGVRAFFDGIRGFTSYNEYRTAQEAV